MSDYGEREDMTKQNNPFTPSETEEQAAVVQWCDLVHIPIVHVPNEGKRSVSYGAALKREGMRPGFPDLFVPVAKKEYHGLFIEMKVGKNKPTADQTRWINLLNANGYKAVVCYGYDQAVSTIIDYMK